MNTFGKTIRLFLVDGTTNSLTTAELSNWTGIGIKVPRIKIKDYQSRAEFQKPGVYILIGKDENNEDAAYIGEAEIVYDRLLDHISKKEFWNEVVFFGSKDKYLNKASVKYLENRLHDLAIKAGRYKVEQNLPTRPELSEAEQAELEEFLSNIKILTSTLGHKIFETLEETVKPSTLLQDQLFYCKSTAGVSAKGSPSTEGFLVYKDSLFALTEQPAIPDAAHNERQRMIQEGLMIQQKGVYLLTQDYVFNSPSRAAGVALGRSASGPMEWKTASGVQLKQLEEPLK